MRDTALFPAILRTLESYSCIYNNLTQHTQIETAQLKVAVRNLELAMSDMIQVLLSEKGRVA